MKKPNWKEWSHTPEVRLWQACALSLDIDPHSLKHSHTAWMGGPGGGPIFDDDSFPSGAVKAEYELRLRVLRANLSNPAYFSPGSLNMESPNKSGVRLDEFAAWALDVMKWDGLPAELEALARAPEVESVERAVKAVSRTEAQDAAIIDAIRAKNYDPLFLPKPKAGKRGLKAELRTELTKTRKDIFVSTGVFEKAWERLQGNQEIRYMS